MAAGVGLLSLVAALAALVLGIRPLVFISDSMSPAIPIGSLALARSVPAGDLKVGDVVSVQNSQGVRVTHRIEAIQPATGGTVELTLRGDANPVPDAQTYTLDEAEVVWWSSAGLGRALAALQSRPVLLGVGLVIGVWVGWWLRASLTGRSSRASGESCPPDARDRQDTQDARGTRDVPEVDARA